MILFLSSERMTYFPWNDGDSSCSNLFENGGKSLQILTSGWHVCVILVKSSAMATKKRVLSSAILATAMLGAFCIATPAASATDNTSVTSVRSFPAQKRVNAQSAFIEATSVEVSDDSDWGGVESLSVSKVESPAEKAAKEAAAAQAAQQAAASRSAARSSRSSTNYDAIALPTSKNGAAIASYAQQFTGVPYVYSGTTTSGWDCSGFTAFVFAKFGVSLPHQSELQRDAVASRRVSNPEPGDLMWTSGHVGIYLGNGMMVHAANARTGTVVSPVYTTFQYYRVV